MWTCDTGVLLIHMRGLFVSLRGHFVHLKGPCAGLKEHSYSLIIYVDLFRPKRAICRCGRACAALRGPSYSLQSKWALFRPKRAICRCGRACAALRGPSYGLQSKWALFRYNREICWYGRAYAARAPCGSMRALNLLEYTQDARAEKPFYGVLNKPDYGYYHGRYMRWPYRALY